MKIISILGSTGSFGTQTIEVIQRMNSEFDVKYLSANNNVDLLVLHEMSPGIVDDVSMGHSLIL